MYLISTIFIIIIIFYNNIVHGKDFGYPTITQAGFHHNALLYIDGNHSPEKLMLWLTGSYETIDSYNIIFDTITILVEKTSSNSLTTYSTNEQDWIWFLEIKLFNSYGILSNLTKALKQLNISNKKLQIIIMLPYIDSIGQQNFSLTLNLSIQNHRQQIIQWYIDTIKEKIKQYDMLHFWGMYLMREDINYGINEQIILEISHIIHKKQLRLLWIPYTNAINWNNWINLGIDIAILQPGYAFSSPLMQGTYHAGRLRSTAKLAQKYGLGVEIEINQGANTEYDIEILQNYLAQGYIDGYQYVPTTYFLGNYDSIAQSKKACNLIRNYTSGHRIEPTYVLNTKWFWIINENLQAIINISSNIIPKAIRINWSLKHKYWFGRIIVDGFIIINNNNSIWKLLSSIEIGEKNWRDEDWTSTLLPFSLLSLEKILTIRISFINSNFLLSLTDEDLIIEQISNGIALQISTGARYHISPSMFFYNPQYGDIINETISNFSRGLLTDRQWSNDEWHSSMSIGWLDNSYTHSYIRIALDFGDIIYIDQILIRSHSSSYEAVHWPNTARLLISTDCIPLSPYSSSDCIVNSYPCTDRIITGGTDMNQGGILSFTFSNYLRWATLEFQPNSWFMIDEIQAFVNGRDISNLINYYFLTPPTSKTLSNVNNYLDDGIRLTDGVIAGMIGSITGWLKNESYTITIDLLMNRNIRETSIWTLIKPDWSISPPRLVEVSISLDGLKWNLFGEQGQMQIGERILDAQRLFINTNNISLTRYIKFNFIRDELFPGWWTMVSEVTATN
ncbi:unnamed protein product [Rotaria sp. Silwood1]|nr:unnamed protein product [Rotaria sp. Silwood1]CAF4938923.1 unnamed protein product [Rotaria sp. Silwood1]